MSFKVVRTSKTRVTNLQGFNVDRQKPATANEPDLKKEETPMEESSVGDAFEELFGEAGEEVKPEDQNVPKRHVKRDDESDEEPLEDVPPKPEYSGDVIEEGVNPSKTTEVESSDLDDLISAAMDDLPDEQPQQPPEENKRSSTPTEDRGGADNGADFGGFLSMIRDDSAPPPATEGKDVVDTPRDIPTSDRRSGVDDNSRDSLSGGKSLSTTSTYSFSSKFVPNIPASFYKNIQTKLEDLIFKFECLDNEYAALQKISHKMYTETMDVKKIFSNES